MLIKKLVTEVKMPEDLFHETLKLIDDFTLLNFIRDIHKLKKEDFLFAKDSEDIFQELHEEGKVNIGDQAYYAPHTLVRLYRNLEKHLFFSNIYLNLGN